MFVSTTNVSPRTDRTASEPPSARSHDQVIDLLQRRWLQQADVVPNATPIEIHALLPIANAHHLTQAAMLFRQSCNLS